MQSLPVAGCNSGNVSQFVVDAMRGMLRQENSLLLEETESPAQAVLARFGPLALL